MMRLVHTKIPALVLTMLSLTAVSGAASAGVRESGGGIAVHCGAGTAKESYQLLDLYEATASGYRDVMEPWSGADRIDLIEYALDPVMTFDWSRSVTLYDNAKEIDEDLSRRQYLEAHPNPRHGLPIRVGRVEFADSLERIETDFHLMAAVPANCELVQLAVQRWEDRYTSAFVFNHQVWNKLDLVNQAAAILHEVIYEEDRQYNHAEYSDATRYEVGILFTTGAHSYNEYDALESVKFSLSGGFHGFSFR